MAPLQGRDADQRNQTEEAFVVRSKSADIFECSNRIAHRRTPTTGISTRLCATVGSTHSLPPVSFKSHPTLNCVSFTHQLSKYISISGSACYVKAQN